MRKGIIFILLLLCSNFKMQAQQLNSFIDSMASGERRDTTFHFSRGNELEYLPVTVIKGKESGPVFTIIAGIHGYEYPPIIALQELMREIDADELRGTLIILPIANTASFYRRTPFINPFDGKNLNTSFPGSDSGTTTEQIADWITRELIPLSDVFLDIHGGDANEDLLPFICYYNNEEEADKTDKARLLSEASGMEYIISRPRTLSIHEPAL